ncbi:MULTISPECIES: DUF1833 family protein [unclassified Bradyrhizobium]|uniref:DUF1833 family protein n=1 Tax=unclassified Bradyrhizobium TaxID=2631580 RepID=UPI001BA55144|nr:MULTISPECIES: DUF1833 family protein [unclassified Bradyrhizobium]WLA52382.1 DUF1833 family protein [Bradyrhizobium elkanii]MBR1206954.1 DUF1833 family protein [Bradyrhizobium sp. AUGA SZCCT0124]MBR1313493.1 DUF1833 family protein [Bradyrhizobium sp. AUGA SZCCT0051]MBR1343410.1 DUF1833 family protein [Bradyrhizobium sp. AUGA SZCCT0105]MBR1357170.1 DUF1833 family protein [Bradyrhizobium sp. AUGA SZCCT0045]
MPTHNEALLEAYASCPPSARIYYTLELWQSSFDQPARVVANVGDDMAFGLEVGAPRDAGETVTFIACPFQAGYPEQKEGQPPSTTIKIDNVNRELVPKIRAAQGAREYIQVLYREYLGSDLTEPAYGPIEFELRSVQMVGASLTGTVMVKNLQNKRFPRLTKNYDYVQFPSLLP